MSTKYQDRQDISIIPNKNRLILSVIEGHSEVTGGHKTNERPKNRNPTTQNIILKRKLTKENWNKTYKLAYASNLTINKSKPLKGSANLFLRQILHHKQNNK